MGKKKMIATVVNTETALRRCLLDNVPLFCIENPLYSAMAGCSTAAASLSDYDIEDYPGKEVAILKKVRGINPFNEDKYEVFYLPLAWEGWHS